MINKNYILKFLFSALLCCFVQTINSQNANLNLLSHVDVEDASMVEVPIFGAGPVMRELNMYLWANKGEPEYMKFLTHRIP